MSSDLTLYFLNASRAIRIAWLLEELDQPYKLVFSNRASNNLGPPEFKAKIPAPLKKSPTIKDGDIIVQESGAIVEYLCEKYDKSSRFIPKDTAKRAKVREWIAAAEGTFMLHALAILYARWRLPESARSCLPEFETGLSPNVHNDLDWLESELSSGNGKYIVGDSLTAADIMMHFSIQFILAKELGVKKDGTATDKDGKEKSWKAVVAWLERIEREEEGYKKAVERTGYVL